MANNADLRAAKANKKDEFYTSYADIETEMNSYIEYNPNVFRDKVILLPCDDPEWSNFTKYFVANFKRFGLKKLISTSYALSAGNETTTSFEANSPLYDADKHATHGKMFVMDRNIIESSEMLAFTYLEGDGDFRSDEVRALRDEADIIITNPPFSLFRAFVAWVLEADKQLIILGNLNAVTTKEIFPLVKANKLWFGPSIHSGDREFRVPDDYPLTAAGWRVDADNQKYIRVKGVRWYTNVDHGVRHEELVCMSTADNLKFHKKLKKKLQELSLTSYPVYDNYNAIEVPFTDAIPSDYPGVMGVPITFLDKHNPNQFEILGASEQCGRGFAGKLFDDSSKVFHPLVNGEKTFSRLFIKHKEV